MNSRARRVISGPNTCNTTGPESTMSGPMRASTWNGSLSSANGKCEYFLAKSADQMAHIALVMDDESYDLAQGRWVPVDMGLDHEQGWKEKG
uniref:Uncharacterized protein n=1 Tax=Romanomermis culicivorax TaxID=13658 RepID=A0A915KKQ9_ROMCU